MAGGRAGKLLATAAPNTPRASFALPATPSNLFPSARITFRFSICRVVSSIDPELLQKRYYELHRRLHPDLLSDRATGGPAGEPAEHRGRSTAPTAACAIPSIAALYWLTLQGESLGADNNRVPPDLAALVFEVQEQLEELRAARDGNGAAQALVERDRCRRGPSCWSGKAPGCNSWRRTSRAGTPASAMRPTLTRELKAILSALAYLGTLLRDVEKELET